MALAASVGRIRRVLGQALEAAAYAAMVAIGFGCYLVTEKTPMFAHQSMIRLFCLTSGRSNDWISTLIGFFKRAYRFGTPAGVIAEMSDPTVRDRAVRALRESGYYLFEQRLSGDMCDRLLRYAMTQPCELGQMDDQQHADQREAVYVRGKPQAVRYNFKTNDLLRNPDVQNLIADLSFADLAQSYLGARPIIDALSMWWLTDYSDQPDAQAAQFFHFDMDRPKWLKIFIYLTDVYSDNGPHSFVMGSHKSGGIPRDLLKKRYARLSDEEVARCYDKTEIKEIVAPRGAILAEDTRGLHKGKIVSRGDRLMLQIQFSNSLFGARYPKVSMGGDLTPNLRDRIRDYPALYSTYL
jgi:hypothetical protein